MKLKTIVRILFLVHATNAQSIPNAHSLFNFPPYETCLDRSVTPAHQTNCLYETLHKSEAIVDNGWDRYEQQCQEYHARQNAFNTKRKVTLGQQGISLLLYLALTSYHQDAPIRTPQILTALAYINMIIFPLNEISILRNQLESDREILNQDHTRLATLQDNITTLKDILLRRPANEISSPFE